MDSRSLRSRDAIVVGSETLAELLWRHTQHLGGAGRIVPEKADLSCVDLEAVRLRGLDLSGVCLAGADLRCADLSSADLSGADLLDAVLSGAVLRGANLRGANLQKASLVAVDLREAILDQADLRDSNLDKADLRGSRMNGTDFRGASLRDADLRDLDQPSRPTLSAGIRLGGSNLTNARLPTTFRLTDDIKSFQELAGSTYSLGLVLASGLAYCALTLFANHDGKLLTNTGSAELPILKISIPILQFFLFAPLLILIFHFYVHLNLREVLIRAAGLPTQLVDGSSPPDKVGAWIVAATVNDRLRSARLPREAWSSIEKAFRGILIWGGAPFLISLFWFHVLVLRDTGLNLVLTLFLLAASAVGGASFHAVRGATRSSWRLWLLIIFGVAGMIGLDVSGRKDWAAAFSAAKFERHDISDPAKPADVRGANLSDSNLAHVNAAYAFLANANLRAADVSRGDFTGADIRSADFRRATLFGAIFIRARLSNANFEDAVFIPKPLLEDTCGKAGAVMAVPAEFDSADLSETIFGPYEMCRVSFFEADLSGASFINVLLMNADFSYSHADRKAATFEGSSLNHAKFTSARFPGAKFISAHLTQTNFRGANLANADFSCATIVEVEAAGATLTGATLSDEQVKQFKGVTGLREMTSPAKTRVCSP